MAQDVDGPAPRDVLTGAALIFFCVLISMGIPLAGIFSYVLIPAPVLFYRLKLGRRLGAAIPAAAFLLLAALSRDFSFRIFFTGELLLAGFVMGELLRLNLSIEKTALYACVGIMGTGLAAILFYSGVSSHSIYSLVSAYVSENLNFALEMMGEMDMPEDSRLEMIRSFEGMKAVLLRVLPGLAAVFVLFMVWANILTARVLLKARGIPHTDFGPLNLWKAPEFMVWAVIGCGIIVFIPMDPGNAVKTLCVNLLLILTAVYFFQGIAVISHFFERKKFSRGLKIFAFSMIAVWQALFFVVAGLGFFDLWANFRKLETGESKKGGD
ncbi:conserved membrane hypothetical protein [Candidatus Desulfarcum epimagneticum]|uniref:DUF2232 domain-containing protein n=1 Tax=uncultured Desulfobacteraceae bacterium TaxID=218296 RepID=A0A484HBH0_9BACT|nr:conserved membrane hypothetical protein [uncultured Desulfobacteraceae bacterium]